MAPHRRLDSMELPLWKRVWHHTKQVLAVGGSLGLMAAAVLFADRVWVWAWPSALLPFLYLVAAVLYRYEDRLPSWASRLLDLAADQVFTISWLARMEAVREANAELLDNLDLTLREYGLGVIGDVEKANLARHGKVLRLKPAAERVAGLPSVDGEARTIALLYRERCGLPTINLWQSHREELVASLPPVLVKSERVPLAPDGGSRTTAADLAVLLASLRDFDIELLAMELRLLTGLRERVHRYVRFLDRHGIETRLDDPTAPRSGEPRVVGLHHVESEIGLLPDGATTLFRLEDPDLALGLLMERDRSESDVSRLVHAGVFLTERESSDAVRLIERLCRRAASEPRLAVMLHAYLWEKEKVRRSPQLNDLDENWKAWVDDARVELDAGYEAEVEDLRSELETGSWPTVKSGASYLTVEVTLEHDEVRDVDLYLITTDGVAGPVSDLVKCLKRTPAANPQLGQLGIELEVDGRPKYRFDNFTKNTQLGVVPRGMPFHDFYEGFVRDVDILLRNRERTLPDVKWLPRLSDMVAIEAGEERTITLWETGTGPIDFEIVEQPRHGSLLGDPLPCTDGTHAEVTYAAGWGIGGYTCDSFAYAATGPGRPVIERRVHIFLRPPFTDPRPGGVVSAQYGKPRLLTLRDRHKGVSDFAIVAGPRHGTLGAMKRKNDDQVVVTYVPDEPEDGVERVQYDEIEYEATSARGHGYPKEPIRLLVYPEGVMQLSQFEITIDRVDPGHSHELWFGDAELGSRARPPSVCNVWKGIEASLDPVEYDDVKRCFDQIAGGAGCSG